MPRQLLVIDGDDNERFSLTIHDGTLTVGADAAHAEIVVGDLRVLRIHCELEVDANRVVVRNDLAAPTGQELGLGRALDIGHAHVRLVALADDPAASDADIPAIGDGVRSAREDAAVAAPAPSSAAGADPASAPTPVFKRLIVIDGADHGRTYPLPETGITTIGNSQKHADIVLHDLYVARVHCELEAQGQRLLVTHRESARGTLINGTRVTTQELQLGDILRVGNSHLRLELAVAEARPAGGAAANPAAVANPQVPGSAEPAAKNGGTAIHSASTSGSGPNAASPPSPHDPPIDLEGQVLGHYQFGALLGRGQSGLVFRAHHRQSNHAVTVKVLSPDFPNTDAELHNFVRALKVVAPLRHPNLVTLHAVGKTGPYCWLARDYVEGESLATLIARLHTDGKFAWKRACRVAVHLGKVLDFLHQHGVTHGNLTPSNILIQGETKSTLLADLMLDKALEGSELAEMIREKKLLAELPYYAPEQLDIDAPTDHRTGLYALGTMLYALLTGAPPFTGSSPEAIIAQILEANVVRPSKILRETPAPFEAAVLKMLARRPEDRYQTAAEMLAVVEPIANIHEIKV